jgi:hypothetical protein
MPLIRRTETAPLEKCSKWYYSYFLESDLTINAGIRLSRLVRTLFCDFAGNKGGVVLPESVWGAKKTNLVEDISGL